MDASYFCEIGVLFQLFCCIGFGARQLPAGRQDDAGCYGRPLQRVGPGQISGTLIPVP